MQPYTFERRKQRGVAMDHRPGYMRMQSTVVAFVLEATGFSGLAQKVKFTGVAQNSEADPAV